MLAKCLPGEETRYALFLGPGKSNPIKQTGADGAKNTLEQAGVQSGVTLKLYSNKGSNSRAAERKLAVPAPLAATEPKGKKKKQAAPTFIFDQISKQHI